MTTNTRDNTHAQHLVEMTLKEAIAKNAEQKERFEQALQDADKQKTRIVYPPNMKDKE